MSYHMLYIYLFTHLMLNLEANNSFTGTIPTEIGVLDGLKEMNFGKTYIAYCTI